MPSRSGYQRWRDGWLLLGRQDRKGLRVIALECWLGHVPFKRYPGAWSSLDIAQALSVNRCSANFHGSSRPDEKEPEFGYWADSESIPLTEY